MMRGISLVAICFSLALTLPTASLHAMPISGAAKGLVTSAAAASAIQRVHGCHAVCRRGPAGWHRHGPRCGRIRCW